MRVTLESTNLKLDLDHPDYSTLYELSDYAELIGVKPQRRYRLDRDLIQRALQRSVTFDHILRFLETITGDALPDRLVTQLHEWAAQLDQISLRRVTLLEVRDPEVLTDLTRAHRVRQSLGRTLSPRAIVVREPRVPALLRQLAKRGLIPRTNLPADQLSHHRTTQLSSLSH